MDTNGVIKSPIFKVLVSDPIHERGVEILESVAQVTIKTKLSEEELCAIIGEYDALVVRSGTTVTAKVIEQATRMKIIGRAGVGVDNIDIEASTAHGIYVVCSPLGNTVAAAEHTLALMFALSRNITVADSSIRAGLWERSRFMGIQLQHKTLGIIGLGQVE
uniref:Haptoglobin-related protein n=1 Tax=Cardiosporidium cionae TaxID=476202 RepID=A0A3S8V2T0_9APIC|nr:haptoglobin-related protein [Cardiosporidium cionae]